MYSSKEFGFFTISGNLGTQYPQAVGWAMASAYKGDDRIAAAYIGDGATGGGRLPQRAHLRRGLSRARDPQHRQQPVGHQLLQRHRGGHADHLRAKGIAYGLPTLRVDGNDFLAVTAATQWAEQRARSNLGATVIEFVSYRAAQHSTSDDPSRYRPADDFDNFPLGDPIARLRRT
jgi:2-oxoisovalerate dehydrogenase E1 component alpha subunit